MYTNQKKTFIGSEHIDLHNLLAEQILSAPKGQNNLSSNWGLTYKKKTASIWMKSSQDI